MRKNFLVLAVFSSIVSIGCAKTLKKEAYPGGDVKREIFYQKLEKEKGDEKISLYFQAIYDIKRGRLQEAETKLEKLISESKNKKEEIGFPPYFELALLKYRLKKQTEASKILDESEEKAKTEKDFENLYALRMRLGENDKAILALEKAFEKFSQNQRLFRTLISELMKQGQVEKAKDIAKKYTERNKNDATGFVIYGELLKFTGEKDKAEENFKMAMELGFLNEQVVSELLEIYKEKGEIMKAIELSENFIKESNEIMIKRQLVDLLLEAGESEKALSYMYEITREINEPEIMLDFARVLLKAKKPAEVIRITQEVEGKLNDQESKDIAILFRAYALYELKKYEEALKEFEKIDENSKFYSHAIAGKIDSLREISPDKAIKYGLEVTSRVLTPEVMQSLIFAFREKENYDSAFELLDFSLKKFDKNKDLLYTKAILHYEVGDIKKALETADLLFEISQQDPHSLNLKGYMMVEYIIEEKRKTGFYDTNKLDEARKLIEEALKRRPKDPYIIDSLGWYFFAKGDIEKAEEMIRKAYEMKPDDAVIAEHLADILVLKNEEEKALELYKTGLQKGKPKGYDRLRIERKIKELEHKIRAKIKNKK